MRGACDLGRSENKRKTKLISQKAPSSQYNSFPALKFLITPNLVVVVGVAHSTTHSSTPKSKVHQPQEAGWSTTNRKTQ